MPELSRELKGALYTLGGLAVAGAVGGAGVSGYKQWRRTQDPDWIASQLVAETVGAPEGSEKAPPFSARFKAMQVHEGLRSLTQPVPPDVDSLLQRAMRLGKEGRWEESEPLLDRVLAKIEPRRPPLSGEAAPIPRPPKENRRPSSLNLIRAPTGSEEPRSYAKAENAPERRSGAFSRANEGLPPRSIAEKMHEFHSLTSGVPLQPKLGRKLHLLMNDFRYFMRRGRHGQADAKLDEALRLARKGESRTRPVPKLRKATFQSDQHRSAASRSLSLEKKVGRIHSRMREGPASRDPRLGPLVGEMHGHMRDGRPRDAERTADRILKMLGADTRRRR